MINVDVWNTIIPGIEKLNEEETSNGLQYQLDQMVETKKTKRGRPRKMAISMLHASAEQEGSFVYVWYMMITAVLDVK